VEYLGFPTYMMKSSAMLPLPFFPILIPFVSISYLIAVASTSKTTLIRHDEGEHPCFVPDYRGKIFSFSPLNMMLAELNMVCGLYCVEIHSSSLLCFLS
jgi:hypothetical protein